MKEVRIKTWNKKGRILRSVNVNLPKQFSIKAKVVSLWDSEGHFRHKISKSSQKGNVQTDHCPLLLYYHLKIENIQIFSIQWLSRNKKKPSYFAVYKAHSCLRRTLNSMLKFFENSFYRLLRCIRYVPFPQYL